MNTGHSAFVRSAFHFHAIRENMIAQIPTTELLNDLVDAAKDAAVCDIVIRGMSFGPARTEADAHYKFNLAQINLIRSEIERRIRECDRLNAKEANAYQHLFARVDQRSQNRNEKDR